MSNYLKPINHILKEVSFEYLDGLYSGPGILKWHPETGFHLEAFLKREGRPLPKEIKYRSLSIARETDLLTFRMKLWPSGRAIAPNVSLAAKLGLIDFLDHGWLSIKLSRVFFLTTSTFYKPSKWIGSATYRIAGISRLFEPVTRKALIDEYVIQTGHTFSGIRVKEDEKRTINGMLDEDGKTLELHWSFSADHYSKEYSWRWAEEASVALSILYGQTVWMVKREIYRRNSNYVEVRKYGDTHDLDYLSFFHPLSIEKNQFLELADFFAKEKKHAETCRNIFNQMLEASKQETIQAQELMISTILEAVLRNIDNHPFKEGDQSWNIRDSMKSFRKKHLSDKWKESCSKALDARKRLRHRNAHPDWLFSKGGALSDEEREKSLDDTIFLSKFYGYVILALAGFKELEPKFPKPHREWDPLITRSSKETIDNRTETGNGS